MTRRGALLFAAMCVIWGLPYLLIKVAVRSVHPASLVFLRTAIGGVLLAPVAWRAGRLDEVLARWRPLVAYTIVELAIPWVLLSTAEERLPSSLSGLLVAAVPLVGVGLARLSGRAEHLDVRRTLGLLLGVAGVAALVGFDVSGANAGSVAMLGVVVVGYALGPQILSHHLRDLPGTGVVAGSLVLCALAYAPVGIAEMPAAFPSWRVVAAVAVLGVVCTALAFVCFFGLIAEIGPVRATVITYVNPAVAVLLGVAFLHEGFGAGTGVGFVLVLGGSVLATGAGRGAPRERAPVVAEP